MEVQDKLANELGIEPLVETIDSPAPAPAIINTPGLPSTNVIVSKNPDDFEFARENIRELIKAGMLSLEDLKAIAIQASSIYAYETYGALIKTLSETSKDLLTLSEKKKKISENGGGLPSTGGPLVPIQANTVFIGGTHQLGAILKGEGILNIQDAVFEDITPSEPAEVPVSEKKPK